MPNRLKLQIFIHLNEINPLRGEQQQIQPINSSVSMDRRSVPILDIVSKIKIVPN